MNWKTKPLVWTFSSTIQQQECKNVFLLLKKQNKNSPQDGCQMVQMDLILAKLFHTTITTNLHYNMHTFRFFALILNTLDYVVH